MNLAKMIALVKENAIKESVIVLKNSQEKIAVQECALEIALETENAIKEYVYVIRVSKENYAKKPK